jgi:hypothetical protein
VSRYFTAQTHRVMCHDALFMETTPGPPELEKKCVDVRHPGCTGMYYVTRISHKMQKHKIGVLFPGVLSMETAPGLPENKK